MSENVEITGTVEDAIRVLLAHDDDAAREYLKESFLTRAMLALFNARRDVGLTQAQLAERLGTQQSSIARLERDLSGSVTLRRFVEVALACGVMPF
ncbi:MAG: helix-turn-helix domain-containing protein, partial [Ktedonobacterales bacterium]